MSTLRSPLCSPIVGHVSYPRPLSLVHFPTKMTSILVSS
uniref:Uncharacterized protein n=1 Tax=Arundo donax TaxID=35708 RepID=A0A0A8Y153_ARUDO